MQTRRVTNFEFQLLEKLWELGPSSVREVQESLQQEHRPAYTTIQTMIYRLEEKGAVRRMKKIGNASLASRNLQAPQSSVLVRAPKKTALAKVRLWTQQTAS